MTKLKVDSYYVRGLADKRDIAALQKKGSKPAAMPRIPQWIRDGATLCAASLIGGACAWVAWRWFV